MPRGRSAPENFWPGLEACRCNRHLGYIPEIPDRHDAPDFPSQKALAPYLGYGRKSRTTMNERDAAMEQKNADYYPMPSFATLAVRDVGASVRWYQEALGFDCVFVMPGPGGASALAHMRWTKYADLLLVAEREPVAGPKGAGISLSYQVTTGTVDDIANKARAKGAKIIHEPGDRPWNARDFTVADPDGFNITFTMGPVKKDMTMEEIVANAGRA